MYFSLFEMLLLYYILNVLILINKINQEFFLTSIYVITYYGIGGQMQADYYNININ